jgi:hypothetical protein
MEFCDMPFDINEITLYNPLQNAVSVIPDKKVKEYNERLSYNKFKFTDIDGNVKTCFKKFITLVDYVKYLIGKYKPEEMNQLPNKEHSNDTVSKFQEYIHSVNNYAYVDGFFYYLTSKLLNAGFVHGLEFYDNYVCLTKECEINIADDFEYLCDSKFFNENMNTLFHFKDEKFSEMFKKNDKLDISDETVEILADELDDLNEPTIDNNVLVVPDETYNDSRDSNDDNSSANDSDHSTVDNSDSESESDSGSHDNNTHDSNGTDEWGTDNGSDVSTENDEESKEETENLLLVIKKIPTNVIAIECCESTLDSILENNKMTIEELESAMFQVIAMLYLYQETFKFTHNDLHTNNIMYVTTTKEFLHYKILGKYYKIPTYGKIYKIIDFGRAIYKVNNTLLCSDSFSVNGTAHTQYNCEPFYNPEKPVIEPNFSFDLCRLACSMIDFIIEDFSSIDDFRQIPIYDLIISWLYDDNGINVLYKKNGDERYPEFKLYKMIARIVHNHTPEKQFSHACFKSYETGTLNDCMDLDEIKKKVHL